MTNHGGDEEERSRRLLRLTEEPVLFRTLVMLNDGPATVEEVAEALRVGTEAATRCIDTLVAEGFVEPAGEALQGGTVGTIYRARVRTLWSDEEWAAISLRDRQRLSAWTVDWVHADLLEAIEAGTVEARPDSHISRNVAVVDERGWRELTRIQREALEASFAVQAESAERLAESGEDGMAVLSAMFCCELPPRTAGRPRALVPPDEPPSVA